MAPSALRKASLAAASALAVAVGLLWIPAPARAACATTGNNQTCTNPAGITVSGGGVGINDTATLTLANFGTVTGATVGTQSQTANVTNFGTISGGLGGIFAFGIANVTNFGTISSADNSTAVSALDTSNVTNSGTISAGSNGTGIFGFNNVNVTNSGTISVGAFGTGISANNIANVTNSGTISAGTFGTGIEVFTKANVTNSGTISGGLFGIRSQTTANVTNSGIISGGTGILASGIISAPSTLLNSGTIIGTGGTAINFSASHTDLLTFLPGTRIQGAILLGAGDTVNVVSGPGMSSLLTFTPNGPFTLNGSGGPFVVAGSQIATLDATPFGLADKALMDFTRGISGILGSLGGASATSGPLSTAFAPTERDSLAARVDDAFASVAEISALGYASNSPVFKAPTYVAADGRAVWARAFGGVHTQEPDGVSLAARTTFFGGAVGFDMVARSDLRLGLFAGGGQSRLSVDQNSGSTSTDTAFGGVYGRWGFVSLGAPSFLDFALHGGGSTNATSRTLTSNVAPFVQVATASYDSSYVSPELKYGVNLPVWHEYTLTPSIGLRYVAGFFGGYTETGSSANLTVAGRTIQDLEERGELKLTRATPVGPDLLLTSLYVGALGIERLGDTTVNTVLLGASLPFVTPGRSTVGGALGGGGIEWRTREGVSIFGAAEAIAMSDQSMVWSARGGIRVAF